MNINGKTVLITGGGSGIGLEAAKQFPSSTWLKNWAALISSTIMQG